ncbi:MAG: YvcK family protein [Firmicutes bacterium]|nr:YvcK family protein [Bacillota bacterium]
MVLGIIGLLIFALGISPLITKFRGLVTNDKIYFLITAIGGILIFIALKKGIVSLLTIVNKYKYKVDLSRGSVNNMIQKKRMLEKGPKIVVLGGGTGLSILLKGLKEYTSNITAIVTVADDGGGSGVLREDLGMLPPGDIRSCIISLADTEPNMEKLLQYRFEEGKLKGQSFGNLFIAAMNGIYGNFEKAIKEMGNVLAVKGKVLPMTLENVTLFAKLENGQVIKGESNIPEVNKEIKSRIEKIFIKPDKSYPLKEAIDSIKDADAIMLGPGSLYTSVIPNILIKDIVKYINESDALKIYVPNVMTQPGETDNYNVLEHVEAVLDHSKKDIIDYVIANNELIPKEVLDKYNEDGADPVYLSKDEEEKLKKMNIKVVKDRLIDIKSNYIRHDAIKLSSIIVDLVLKKGMNKEKINIFEYIFKKGS